MDNLIRCVLSLLCFSSIMGTVVVIMCIMSIDDRDCGDE